MAEPTPIPTHRNFQGLRGRRFGRLVVVGYSGKRGHNHGWLCRCDCGAERVVQASNLTSGNSNSCGCYNRELTTKHGHSGGKNKRMSPTYLSWVAMCQRTTSPTHDEFPNYGGAGITTCARWLYGDGGTDAFECFLADMGERPSRAHTIDRIENDQGYSPDNCRWATKKQQARNRRTNVHVTYRGVTSVLVEMCEAHSIGSHLVGQRLRRGWSIEEAMDPKSRRNY